MSIQRSQTVQETTEPKGLPVHKRIGPILLALVALLFLGIGSASSSNLVIPTISINSVATDQTVTITTYNYPPNQTFTVRMHYMGTLGVGGQVVGTLNSGSGGSLTQTYTIPDYLRGQSQVAIRLDSPQGYYSFNWFWNNTTGTGNPGPVTPPPGGYTGIPTFSITGVNADQTVTITTNNFPANQLFDVYIGLMYTQGIGGIKVGEINSGSGGTLTQTFNIPDALKGQGRLSIRAQTRHAYPYYAYNWFWNNTTAPGNGTGGQPGYTGIPTIRVCQVTRGGQVEFQTYNYPANSDFAVLMGPMYTQGINGTNVGSFNSGNGGSFRQSFPIPSNLAAADRISIRVQGNPYFSYNWFWNTTTTMDFCN